MSLWAILPVKPLRRGKSRLAGVLSEDERAILNYNMLERTLKTLNEVPEIKQVLVISRDPSALALAREYKARTVKEDGTPELNSAIKRATTVAQVYRARQILVLPADLPLVTAQDLCEFISYSGNPPEMIVSPDLRGDGTNALFVNPPGLIDYCYGPGSFECHKAQARKYHLHLEVCALPSLMFDLDLPEDLIMLKQKEQEQIEIR